MKRTITIGVVLTVTLAIFYVEPALAGPGGKIARAAFETFWGRVALGFLTILFLPLITYAILQQKLSERSARKDRRFMAGYSPLFDWLKIQERAKDYFMRVHSGWEKEDPSGVSIRMSDWYWQNQQLIYLDSWKSERLVDICDVKKTANIRPLLFVHRNHGQEHEGSMVVVSIEANKNDYLQERDTGKVVDGSKRYKEIETVWSFTHENGQWKVSDIEEGSMSLAYAKLVVELPDRESVRFESLMSSIRTATRRNQWMSGVQMSIFPSALNASSWP